MLIQLLRTFPIDALIWITVAVLQLMVAVAVYHGRIFDRYKAFAAYIYFAVIKTTLLMALPPGEHFQTYSWISYSWATVQCFLVVACVADLYAKFLGPKLSLPDWTPRSLGILLGCAIVAALALGIIFKPDFGNTAGKNAIEILGVAQTALNVGSALALLVLAFCARRLGVLWWERNAQIAAGFVLMLTVYSVTLLVVWTGSSNHALLAQRAGQCAGILTLGWWSWVLWEREPAPEVATQEMRTILLSHHRETLESVSVAKEVLE